jgi:hypothetical protein
MREIKIKWLENLKGKENFGDKDVNEGATLK